VTTEMDNTEVSLCTKKICFSSMSWWRKNNYFAYFSTKSFQF